MKNINIDNTDCFNIILDVSVCDNSYLKKGLGIKVNDNRKNNVDDFELSINEDLFNDTVPDTDIRNYTGAQNHTRRTDQTRSIDYYRDEDRKRDRKDHRKRDKIKAIKNRRVFRVVWFCMVILVSMSFAGYLITGSNDLFAVGRREGISQIEIPQNVTAQELGEILYEGNVIKTPEFFTLYCTFTTDADYFLPGGYQLETNLDYQAIITSLQETQPKEVVEDVLFIEGLNVLEVAQILEEEGVCTAAEFLEEVNSSNYDNYDMIGAITNPEARHYKLEGYLFPDKYDFYKNEDISSVVGKLLYNFQSRFSAEMLEEVNNSGYTIDQIVTMASIIQAEAADTEDMYRVSAVIHNRLNSPEFTLLQMDSTIFYPYENRDTIPNPDYTSMYNTYSIQGLPGGAICNPGTEAMKAALNPDAEYLNTYYYFCHSADGTAYYARTLDEHQQNLVLAGLV